MHFRYLREPIKDDKDNGTGRKDVSWSPGEQAALVPGRLLPFPGEECK